MTGMEVADPRLYPNDPDPEWVTPLQTPGRKAGLWQSWNSVHVRGPDFHLRPQLNPSRAWRSDDWYGRYVCIRCKIRVLTNCSGYFADKLSRKYTIVLGRSFDSFHLSLLSITQLWSFSASESSFKRPPKAHRPSMAGVSSLVSASGP